MGTLLGGRRRLWRGGSISVCPWSARPMCRWLVTRGPLLLWALGQLLLEVSSSRLWTDPVIVTLAGLSLAIICMSAVFTRTMLRHGVRAFITPRPAKDH